MRRVALETRMEMVKERVELASAKSNLENRMKEIDEVLKEHTQQYDEGVFSFVENGICYTVTSKPSTTEEKIEWDSDKLVTLLNSLGVEIADFQKVKTSKKAGYYRVTTKKAK